MSITKEENSTFSMEAPVDEFDLRMDKMRAEDGTSRVANMVAGAGTVALELQHARTRKLGRCSSNTLDVPRTLSIKSIHRRPSIAPVPAVMEANGIQIHFESDEEDDPGEDNNDENLLNDQANEDCLTSDSCEEFLKGFPPSPPYIGTSPTLCHITRHCRPTCCLQLNKACEHCRHRYAKEYQWKNPVIIICADYASNGLYNFIVPLRSHARPKNTLNPIIILVEIEPDTRFLETISYFPMVYWMKGDITKLDDLLRAGITLAENIVIVNRESSNSKEDEYLADCNTIVAVQTIFRLFPNANIITELSQSSNMRFMQFRPNDRYALALSKLEKKEKERGSQLSYMFRLPFAAGHVFSASMLDTLLYQAFVKDYLITFVRLLLGIDQAVGSGHLGCIKINKEDLWIRTFGRLYQKLCSTTCEIPIGIYRTQSRSISDTGSSNTLCGLPEPTVTDHNEISSLVKCRMCTLGLSVNDYESSEKQPYISFVIINPSYDLKLEYGDIIYLIQPSSLSPKASPLLDERKMSLKLEKRQKPLGADEELLDKHATYQKDGHIVVNLSCHDEEINGAGVSGTIV